LNPFVTLLWGGGVSAVVVMRRSRTPSCQAGLTFNRVLLGQSTRDAIRDAVAYSWGRQNQLWVEIGAVYNGFCKPQSCQKQKDNYSTASNFLTDLGFSLIKNNRISVSWSS